MPFRLDYRYIRRNRQTEGWPAMMPPTHPRFVRKVWEVSANHAANHTLSPVKMEQLIREDHSAGRPLLAALAVSRAQKGMPGRGFFQLLTELGRYRGPDQGAEAAAHHAREREAARVHWAARPPRD